MNHIEASSQQIDFGIIVALPTELEAVLQQIDNYTQVAYQQSDLRTYYRSDVINPVPIDRVALYSEMRKRIDLEEFNNLCFLFGVDIEELPGDRKSAKVRELILFFERRNQLDKLATMWADFSEE